MKRPLLRHALVLWVLAPLLLSLSLYRPAGIDRGRAARVPDRLAELERVEDYPLTASAIATSSPTARPLPAPEGTVDSASWSSGSG